MDKLLEALQTIKEECRARDQCSGAFVNDCPLYGTGLCDNLGIRPYEWNLRKDGNKIYI